MTEDRKLLTSLELQKLFNKSRHTIWRWEKNGKIPKSIKYGQNKYWDAKEIMPLVAEGVK